MHYRPLAAHAPCVTGWSGRGTREDMVLQTKTPSRVELVKRAADVVPLLRERSLWIDENRRLPDDVIAALEDSGLLKMQLPVQYGGYESDARSLVDVHAELA